MRFISITIESKEFLTYMKNTSFKSKKNENIRLKMLLHKKLKTKKEVEIAENTQKVTRVMFGFLIFSQKCI